MAINKLENMKWAIIIKSKENLPNTVGDFITELVSEEARKTISPYYFILHNVLENKNSIEIIIEGTKGALKNLLSVIKDNLFSKFISFSCEKIES